MNARAALAALVLQVVIQLLVAPPVAVSTLTLELRSVVSAAVHDVTLRVLVMALVVHGCVLVATSLFAPFPFRRALCRRNSAASTLDVNLHKCVLDP